jgi:hypothetical protein
MTRSEGELSQPYSDLVIRTEESLLTKLFPYDGKLRGISTGPTAVRSYGKEEFC